MKSPTDLFVDCMQSILNAHDVAKGVVNDGEVITPGVARKLLKHCRGATTAAQELERRVAGVPAAKEG